MAPTEFHSALNTLGIEQQRVAALFGVGPRSVRRWQYGDRRVPCGVGIVFRLLATGAVTVEQVERAANPAKLATNRVEPEQSAAALESPLVEPASDLAEPALAAPLAEPETERLTGEAPREKAKELVDAGMSVRAAAKALGVPKSTVHRDVSQSESVPKPDRQTKAERRAERELAAKQLALPDKPEQPAILADSVTAVGSELTLAEKVAALTARVCHWPCGDPQHSAFRFCGEATTIPPYCETHRRAAYMVPPPRPARRRHRRLNASARIAWAG
jgi:GcrA cell cycle regulator